MQQQPEMIEKEDVEVICGIKTEEYGLCGMGKSTPDIAVLLRQLNSFSRAVREQAARKARKLSSAHFLILVQAGTSLYRQRKRRSTVVELAMIVSWFPVCLTLFIAFDLNSTVSLLSFWPVLASILAWHFTYVPVRLAKMLAVLLKEADDINLLGPAISMYVRPDDASVKEPLNQMLCRLLPQARADVDGRFTREQKQDLLFLIADLTESTEIRIKGLRALEQVGDERAYEVVRKLSINSSSKIKEAAAHCLDYLKAHEGERREMQTLLRASDSATATPPEHMLRPANPVSDAAPEQLLRPQI